MIQFFRRIRQNLINQEKIGKYLLYAIGEILLVVVGILIALQINIYNEDRKTQKRINAHLSAIERNLIRDSVEIVDAYNLYNRLNRSNDYLWEFINGNLDKIDTTYLKESFIRSGNTPEFSKLKVAWNDLVSSGDVRHLNNEPLRLLLENYYEENFRSNLNIQQRIDYTLEYWDARGPHMNPYMVGNYLRDILAIDTTNIVPLSEFEVDWEGVRNDKHFNKSLVNVISQRIGSLDELNQNNEQLKTLLKEIRRELVE